jgi:hypothetical protein
MRSKRQTTMAKLNRERAVKEKRDRKRAKKQARRAGADERVEDQADDNAAGMGAGAPEERSIEAGRVSHPAARPLTTPCDV